MLGENIRNLREQEGMTQNEVVSKAKKLKGDSGTFTQSQLSKWEKNETLPSDENIELLSKIFNCSKSDLMKENSNRYSFDEIYQEAFSIGRKFKTNEIQAVIYNATESKKNYDDRIKYLTEFLIKSSIPIPDFFIKIMSLCNSKDVNNELERMYFSFIIGFWNGSFEETNLKKDMNQ